MEQKSFAGWCAAIALLACLAAPAAFAITGTMTGDYAAMLNTSGCGAASGQGTFTLSLKAGGKWRLVDESGNVLAGRFVADSSQRVLTLTLDSRSEDYMVALVRDTATQLCGTKAKVVSHSPPTGKIRLGANFMTASGGLSFSGRGKTKFGTGSAKYTANFLSARFRRTS